MPSLEQIYLVTVHRRKLQRLFKLGLFLPQLVTICVAVVVRVHVLTAVNHLNIHSRVLKHNKTKVF